jgi:hypothetical protein
MFSGEDGIDKVSEDRSIRRGQCSQLVEIGVGQQRQESGRGGVEHVFGLAKVYTQRWEDCGK